MAAGWAGVAEVIGVEIRAVTSVFLGPDFVVSEDGGASGVMVGVRGDGNRPGEEYGTVPRPVASTGSITVETGSVAVGGEWHGLLKE